MDGFTTEKEYDVVVCGGGVAGVSAAVTAAGIGYAWDVLRVIPVAILTGQGAAHAACLAIDTAVGVADVDIAALQQKLEQDHIMVHFPDEYVPEDKTVIIHGQNAAEIQGGHF